MASRIVRPKHLILTGAIEREWSKQLGGSLDDCLTADYDAATIFTLSEFDANAAARKY